MSRLPSARPGKQFHQAKQTPSFCHTGIAKWSTMKLNPVFKVTTDFRDPAQNRDTENLKIRVFLEYFIQREVCSRTHPCHGLLLSPEGPCHAEIMQQDMRKQPQVVSERFRLDIRNSFSPRRVVKPQTRLPRTVVEPSFLKEFQRCRDVLLRDMVQW